MELKDLTEQETKELLQRLEIYDQKNPQELTNDQVRAAWMKARQEIIRDYLQELTRKDFAARLQGKPDAILQDIKDTAPAFLRETLESYQEIADSLTLYADNKREKLENCAKNFKCDIVKDALILKKDTAAELLYSKYALHIAELEKKPAKKQDIEKLLLDILNNAPEVNGTLTELPNIPRRKNLPVQSKYIIQNDPTTWNLLNESIKNNVSGQYSFSTGGGFVSLDFSGVELETFRHKKYALNLKEQKYFDIVCTMWLDWQMEYRGSKPFIFTAKEVWRRSRNFDTKDNQKNPSDNQLAEVVAFIDKMSRLYIFVEISKEIESGLLDPCFLIEGGYKVEKGGITNETITNQTGIPLLDILPQRFYNTENHTIIQKGYIMRTPPLLLLYNMGKDGAVLHQRNEFLELPANTKQKSDFLETAAYYIAKQLKIYEAQGTYSNYNKIMLAKLYEATKTLSPKERVEETYTGDKQSAAFKDRIREETKTDRNKINNLLQDWKNRGLIKDFEAIKNAKGGTEGWKITPVMGL